jgi:hypothetical protein
MLRNESLDLASYTMKKYIEPMVFYSVLSVIRQYPQYKNEVKIIMVGGSAIDAWLQNDISHTIDYDFRIIAKKPKYVGQTQKGSEVYPKIEDKSAKIVDEIVSALLWAFQHHLNNYLADNNDIRRSIIDDLWKLGFQLMEFHQGPKFFQLTYKQDPNVLAKSLFFALRDKNSFDVNVNFIDIFPINATAKVSTDEFYPLYRNNLFTTSDDFPIPHFMYHSIPCGTIGYILWDLDRMIDLTKSRIQNSGAIQDKYHRYVAKKTMIQKALATMPMAINCETLRQNFATCKDYLNDDCIIDGKIVNKRELYAKAIEQGFLPDDEYTLEELHDRVGPDYLCDFINRTMIIARRNVADHALVKSSNKQQKV